MATWTNNVPNTFYPDGGNTFTNGVGTFDLECEDGYIFDGDITVKYNGSANIILEQNETKTKVTKAVSNYNGTYSVTFNGKTREAGASEPTVILNMEHVTDESSYISDLSRMNVSLRVVSGYLFNGDPTATYTDTTGTEQTVAIQTNGANTRATGTLYNVGADAVITITGKVRDENEIVINNVDNTTVEYTADGETYDITITCNEGFVFVEPPIITYKNYWGYGQETVTATLSEGNTVATAHLTKVDDNYTIEITGTTKEGTAVPDITNEIANTTESHVYDGETLTITVVSASYPRWRFIDPKATYTNTAGDVVTLDMVITVLQYNSEAVAVITDIDHTKPITVTGSFENVAHVTANLSNCSPTEPLPDFYRKGATVRITLQANAGTEFDVERSKIGVSYENESGYPQIRYFTPEQGNTTVNISLDLPSSYVPSSLTVFAEAYPVQVIGSNYGAINVYIVTLDNLQEFAQKRFFRETGTDPTTGAAIYEKIDLGNYVNRIKRIFTGIAASSTDVLRCGNYNTQISVMQPATAVVTLDFGTVVVPAHNSDNTDYESTVQLFLPFSGFVELSNEYAGKEINLTYVINVVTGNGVALLSCEGINFHVEEVTPCADVAYKTVADEAKVIGGDDWNELLYYGLEPYIYCRWYESAYPTGTNNDRQRVIIGSCRGFCSFDDVDNISADKMLYSEKEEVYRLLQDGVFVEG